MHEKPSFASSYPNKKITLDIVHVSLNDVTRYLNIYLLRNCNKIHPQYSYTFVRTLPGLQRTRLHLTDKKHKISIHVKKYNSSILQYLTQLTVARAAVSGECEALPTRALVVTLLVFAEVVAVVLSVALVHIATRPPVARQLKAILARAPA